MFEGFNRIYLGDAKTALRELPDQCVQTCVTSPPYFGLRDYGIDGQIGAENTPAEFVAALVNVFREVRRVLRDDGTVWLNIGDSYANDDKWGGSTGGKHAAGLHGETGIGRDKTETGLPPKNLIGIPWRVAFGLQDDGWILRRDIIWAKPNPMPGSVTDRPTTAHEYIFLMAKNPHYYYDAEAIKEPSTYPGDNRAARSDTRKLIDPKCMDNGSRARTGSPTGITRNKRSVWEVATSPFKGAHFATFPPDLIQPCILAGAPVGGVVLDPFMGSGTTALVARYHGRQYVGCELNPKYIAMAKRRLRMPFEHQPAIESNVSDLPLFTGGF